MVSDWYNYFTPQDIGGPILLEVTWVRGLSSGVTVLVWFQLGTSLWFSLFYLMQKIEKKQQISCMLLIYQTILK
jgi:hypothetical protein